MSTYEEKQEELGVNLPDIDPLIGEAVVQAILDYPDASVEQLIVGLVAQAPNGDVATEMVKAVHMVLTCKTQGQLNWVSTPSGSILTGVLVSRPTNVVRYGNAPWPHGALIMGPPESVVIRTSRGPARIWVAGPDMTGESIRQSEAVALGNALIEEFGGRIFEDRQGPEVMRDSAIERNMTKRARLKAQAHSKLESMLVEDPPEAPTHRCRTALIESIDGLLKPGDKIRPELGDTGKPNPDAPVYRVVGRLNERWLSIVAEEAGTANIVQPCAWLYADGRVPAGLSDTTGQPYVGFTERASQ